MKRECLCAQGGAAVLTPQSGQSVRGSGVPICVWNWQVSRWRHVRSSRSLMTQPGRPQTGQAKVCAGFSSIRTVMVWPHCPRSLGRLTTGLQAPGFACKVRHRASLLSRLSWVDETESHAGWGAPPGPVFSPREQSDSQSTPNLMRPALHQASAAPGYTSHDPGRIFQTAASSRGRTEVSLFHTLSGKASLVIPILTNISSSTVYKQRKISNFFRANAYQFCTEM